jgi:hypothetical protein
VSGHDACIPATSTCLDLTITLAPQASKWTSDDLYRHAAFCEEWLFRVAAPEPYPLGARLEVVDLKGMRFTDIGSGWFSWCARRARHRHSLVLGCFSWEG